jgi:3-oxoacyl-[acyl-carrier protein] reductase
MKLAGRSAIITGANQGLGKEIARHFLQAGCNVFLVARGEEALRQTEQELTSLVARPGQLLASCRGDVSKEADCARMVRRALELFSELTILVNNAGIYGPMGRFEDCDWNHWVEAISINLLGTGLMTRAILPHLRSSKYGKVINLSGGGATAPLPRFTAYAASKAAIVRLTETLACELKDDCIDVNAIAPGALNTRLLDEVLAAGPDKVGQEFYDRSLKQRDQGGASLARAAALAVYLASAESDGITGRLLSAVWDDWTHLGEWSEELQRSDIYTMRRITPHDRGRGRRCA